MADKFTLEKGPGRSVFVNAMIDGKKKRLGVYSSVEELNEVVMASLVQKVKDEEQHGKDDQVKIDAAQKKLNDLIEGK